MGKNTLGTVLENVNTTKSFAQTEIIDGQSFAEQRELLQGPVALIEFRPGPLLRFDLIGEPVLVVVFFERLRTLAESEAETRAAFIPVPVVVIS